MDNTPESTAGPLALPSLGRGSGPGLTGAGTASVSSVSGPPTCLTEAAVEASAVAGETC